MNKSIFWCTSLLVVQVLFSGGCSSYASFDAEDVACEMPPVEIPAAVFEASVGEEVATTGNIELTAHASERLMTYDVSMRMVVQNIASALDSLKAMTSNLKGYMQSMEENTIIVRIPSARLNEAFEQVAKIGEITSRNIKGTDVTEEMMDLDIRLRTTEETRNRLAELLKKSDKVEELLKVEKEMQRVVGELELIKGRIKYLSHAVAYSTLTVALNSPVAQTEPRESTPFSWVRTLGTDIVLSPGASYAAPRNWWSWLKMELPETFVKLSEVDGKTRAMSGSGVMLMIRRHENFEGGTALFWTKIVRRWLVANKVIAVSEVKEFDLLTGAKGTQFVGTKTVGRTEYQYRLITVVDKKYITTVECWGVTEEVAKEQAVKTLKVKPY
jgi:Domain of unknown function (DUF4349)